MKTCTNSVGKHETGATPNINLIYIADVDLSEKSAPSVHVIQLCRQFASMGHRVTVITAKPKKSPLGPQPFKLVFIPQFNIRGLGGVLFSIALPIRLLYEIISSRVDLIYERAVASPFAAYISWIMRTPHLSELNGWPPNRPYLQRIVDKLSRTLGLRYADAIVSTTQGYKTFATTEYGIPSGRISVLPFGVNEEVFYPRDRATCMDELGLDPAKKYLGYVGSFFPTHDMDTLIRAMKIVTAKRGDVELVLVGDGWGTKPSRKLVADLGLKRCVKFVGEVSFSTVPKYLSVFDVAVQTLTKENVQVRGMDTAKLPEYLACGCAVVATDIPGSETYDSYKKFVYVVPPACPTATADAVIYLLSNANLRNSLGSTGRQYVLANRTWKQVAIQTLEIAAQIMKNQR